MNIKYAYLHPYLREYLYANTREELQIKLAEFAAEVYISHYCNDLAYTVVETLEDGSEKWYAPTGEQIMTPAQVQEKIKQLQLFAEAGKIPVSVIGN